MLGCFTVVSIGRTQHLILEKGFIVQNTIYYSRNFDIMVKACEMSMKVDQPKEVEELMCSFFTTFAVFTNSNPVWLVLMVN